MLQVTPLSDTDDIECYRYDLLVLRLQSDNAYNQIIKDAYNQIIKELGRLKSIIVAGQRPSTCFKDEKQNEVWK